MIRGLTYCFVYVFLFCCAGMSNARAQSSTPNSLKLDSLMSRLEQTDDRVEQIRLYEKINALLYISDMDSAAVLTTIANRLAIDILSTQPDKKLETEMKRYLSSSLSDLGWYFMNKGKIKRAIALNFKALKLNEELGQKTGVASCYQNIGEIYALQGDYKSAIRFLELARSIYESEGESSGVAKVLAVLAEVEMDRHDHEAAIMHLTIAEELLVNEQEEYVLAEIYADLGSVYLEMDDTANSIISSYKAYDLNTRTGSRSAYPDALCNLGRIDLARGHLVSAENHVLEALAAAKKLGFPDRIQTASLLLSEVYEAQENWPLALQNKKLYSKMHDSLINVTNERVSLTEAENYEYSKEKDLQDKVYEKELAIEKKRSARQTIFTFFVFGALVIVIVFSWVSYNRFRTIQHQKEVIEMQNYQILEGMEYSKGIQHSLLPSGEDFERYFSDYFIFYEPKEMVSGDFYWLKKIEDKIIIACADCTGHGVPGGFMSTIGTMVLDRVVADNVTEPSVILSRLSDELIKVLHQQEGGSIQDGMDLSVSIFDKGARSLKMAGARNGVTILRDGKAMRYRADLFPVGGNYTKKGKPVQRQFTTTDIELQSGDWICMYTDGFVEQCGGEEGLPMRNDQFQGALLKAVQARGSGQIRFHLKAYLQEWQRDHERQDDVLVMGVRLI